MPTGLTASVAAPEDELMLTLRDVITINERNGPYSLAASDNGLVSKAKITKLCQRFSLRTINFVSNGTHVEKIKETVIKEISLILQQGLKLIGGFQST